MNEIEIKQLPINDEFAQCMKKLRIYPTKFTQKRQEEMRNCNHLFVKLRECEEVFGFHSTEYYIGAHEVECVHCGLTNRFNRIEELLDSEYIEVSKSFRGMIPSLTKYNKKTLESQIFEETFEDSYFRGGKSFTNSDMNLISEECLQTCHPGLLFHLALQINPLGDNEKMFEIMKKLHQLETFSEKIRLQTKEQAVSLLERYYDSKNKSLVLKKDNQTITLPHYF